MSAYEINALLYGSSMAAYNQETIVAALAAIGTTTKATLLLRPGTWVISDDFNMSSPVDYSNVTIHMPAGSLMQIADTKTVTFAGPFSAGLYQVFSGSGAVVFGEGSASDVPVVWFGPLVSGSVDDITDYCNQAIHSLVIGGFGGRVYIPQPGGTYQVNGTILIPSNIEFDLGTSRLNGSGIGGNNIFETAYITGGNVVTNIGQAATSAFAVTYSKIHNGSIYNCGKAFNLYLYTVSSEISNIYCSSCTYMIYATYTWLSRFTKMKYEDSIILPAVTNAAVLISGWTAIAEFSFITINGRVLAMEIQGAIGGLSMTYIDIEGCTTGIYFNEDAVDQITGVTLLYSFFEWVDTCIKRKAEVPNGNVFIDWCQFWNFGTAFENDCSGPGVDEFLGSNNFYRTYTAISNNAYVDGWDNFILDPYGTFTVNANGYDIDSAISSGAGTALTYPIQIDQNHKYVLTIVMTVNSGKGPRITVGSVAAGTTNLLSANTELSTGTYIYNLDPTISPTKNTMWVQFANTSAGNWQATISIVKSTPDADGEILLSTTNVALNSNSDTILYNVPTSKRCVLTKAILVAGADAGATSTISIGASGSTTDFIPANTLSNLDAANDAVILLPIPNTAPLKNKSYAENTVIKATVANQSGGATNALYLYGMLIS